MPESQSTGSASALPDHDRSPNADDPPTVRELTSYEELISSIDGVVWELDPATFDFLFVSPQAERILGYPIAEWYGTPNAWVKYLHEEDRDRALAFCIEETKAGRDHRFEYRMVAADGRVVWLQDLVQVVMADGQPVRLRGVMYDITRRKEAEEQRRQAIWELEQFFEVSLDAMCILDLEGHFIRVNPAHQAMLGYSQEELATRSGLDLVAPDDREAIAGMLAELAGGGMSGHESRFVRKDGSVLWLQWRALADAANNRLYATARDVTDSHRYVLHQQALRRVATAVAEERELDRVLAVLVEEAEKAGGAAWIARLEPDGGVSVLAPDPSTHPPEVVRIARQLANGASSLRLERWIGSPIVLGNRVWGAIAVTTPGRVPPADAESRLADFAGLVSTAVANAEARTELAASRARLVTLADEVRRRVARDLHDGVQQHLVALALQARTALTEPIDQTELATTLAAVADGLTAAFDEVREVAHGLHPSIISSGGLAAAVASLARRSPIPVEVESSLPRRSTIPEPIELAAYYVVSEALTNAIKHAHASHVEVELAATDGRLELTVRDDGAGGARPGTGLGLVGLSDRVEALGGEMRLASPRGRGTTVSAWLPLRHG